jgi:hypothetical protein
VAITKKERTAMWTVFMCALKALLITDEGKAIVLQLDNYMKEVEADRDYYKCRVDQLIEDNSKDYRAFETRSDEQKDKIYKLEREIERLNQTFANPWALVKGYGVTIYELSLEEKTKLSNDPLHPINVIKDVRERTGVGLKDAKTAVDYYMVYAGLKDQSGFFRRQYNGFSDEQGHVVYTPYSV